MSVCVCVHDKRARFLLRRPQTRCGCWGHRGSGNGGVDGTRLAVHRELSVHFRSFLRGRPPFSNYHSPRLSVFTGLDSLLLTFEFKPIIIILSCSYNMVAGSRSSPKAGHSASVTIRKEEALSLRYIRAF